MYIRGVKLSPPWIGYYREVRELFEADPDVHIEYDDQNVIIRLYVEDTEKADAIAHILPGRKTFGNVTLEIKVIPCNKSNPTSRLEYIEKAFKGNPNFSYIYEVPAEVSQTNPLSYVVFANKVVQYYNDNLKDPHGNVSTLLEIIARDVLGEGEGIYFCTNNNINNKAIG